MYLFQFTEEASRLVLERVQKIGRDIKGASYERIIDEKIFELFLSDIEHEIKFLAVQLAIARGANIVEERDVKTAFRKLWAELLRKRRNFFVYERYIREDLDVIKRKVKPSETFWILDAGCGWGRASKWLHRFLGEESEVVGIDLDVFSLKYGKSLNSDFSFLRVHMSYLPFKPEAFDVILSSKSFHEIESENYRRTFYEFLLSLKLSGLLYVVDSFARFSASKLIQRFLHRMFPKVEVYPQLIEFEMALKDSNFRVLKKSYFTTSMLGLNKFCSYIARKVGG
jgi:ubiquinone/menaquinone biosynthesis C-methylase UbiE